MKTTSYLLPILRALLLLGGLALALISTGERVVRAAPLTINVGMSNPACVQVAAESSACTITFGNLHATSSDPSFSRLEVRVNDKLRVRMQGFFESSAYISSATLDGGLQVACGRPNADGDPSYGHLYSLRVDGYMISGETSWAQTNVYCPYYDGKAFLPLITR